MILFTVTEFLNSIELSESGKVKAEVAKTLASKLDHLREDHRATSAMALPAMARELRELLNQLELEGRGTEDFVSGLFKTNE